MDIFVEIYWAIGIVSICIYLIIYYFEIAPSLKKYNIAGIMILLTNINDDEVLEQYRELCLEEKRSLFWYEILAKMNKYAMLYIIGWFFALFFQ